MICTWHQKASAKNSSKLNKLLHSEVNLLLYHIIVQDQDEQNNNILFNPHGEYLLKGPLAKVGD